MALDKAGDLERYRHDQHDWVAMDLEEAHYVGEIGTILIRCTGVKHMPSFNVYRW